MQKGKDAKIEKKYLMALISAMAQLNALSYQSAQEDKALKENQLQKISLNQKGQDLINNVNNNIDTNINKGIDTREKFDQNQLEKFIKDYLYALRNFYNHSDKNDHKNNAEQKLKELEKKNIFGELMTCKEKGNHGFFRTFCEDSSSVNDNVRLIFLSLFLTRSEIQELKPGIEEMNDESFDSLKDQINHKYIAQYRFKTHQTRKLENIHTKIINFFLQFDKVKNKKNFFIDKSIDLLNYKYSNKNIKFKKHKNTRDNFLIDIINKKTDQLFFVVNFRTLGGIMRQTSDEFINYFISACFAISSKGEKIVLPERKIATKAIKVKKAQMTQDKQEAGKKFTNQFKPESKIFDRALLKGFVRYLHLEKRIDKELHYIDHAKIMQSIAEDAQNYFKNQESLEKGIKNNIKTTDHTKIKNKMKSILFKFLNSNIENFNKLIDYRISEGKTENGRKPKTDSREEEVKRFIKRAELRQLMPKLTDFKEEQKTIPSVLKQKEERDFKFFGPMICLYHDAFEKKSKATQKIDSFKDPSIDPKIIKHVFAKRIPETKNKIGYSKEKMMTNSKNKEYKITLKISDPKYALEKHEVFNDKLFGAYIKLTNSYSGNNIEVEITEDIVNTFSSGKIEYKKKELALIKKIFNYDIKNKESQEYKNRKGIIHRSIHKFKTMQSLEAFIKNRNKKLFNEYKIKKTQKQRQPQNEFDKDIETFNLEIRE